MSYISSQPRDQVERYSKLLKSVGALSKIFSELPEPYISSRAAENIFCKAFEADNLSRSDASADAAKNGVGFGIKTFLQKNGRTMEKVAEFNGDHELFEPLPLPEKIRKIAELRNERIETTKRIFGLSDLTYHCITRSAGTIQVYESPFPPDPHRRNRQRENSIARQRRVLLRRPRGVFVQYVKEHTLQEVSAYGDRAGDSCPDHHRPLHRNRIARRSTGPDLLTGRR